MALVSFAGSDPERRDLFLEAACELDEERKFRVVDQTGGIYLKDVDIQGIEFQTVQEVEDTHSGE
jgi:hypothetical protein